MFGWRCSAAAVQSRDAQPDGRQHLVRQYSRTFIIQMSVLLGAARMAELQSLHCAPLQTSQSTAQHYLLLAVAILLRKTLIWMFSCARQQHTSSSFPDQTALRLVVVRTPSNAQNLLAIGLVRWNKLLKSKKKILISLVFNLIIFS